MSPDALGALRFAIAGARFGGGPATMAIKVRRSGLAAFDAVLSKLDRDQIQEINTVAERVFAAGVRAVLLTSNDYPSTLASVRNAPAALFVLGPVELLHQPALGVCGSRDASDEGRRAARISGEIAASHELSLVSGYARGVDMAAHIGALAADGNTVIVLAEGIDNFRIKRGEFASLWEPARAVVVSQFSPAQPWSAGAAMTRNAVISGLSRALVVVEAGQTGGTLAAGLHALDRGQPVMVLNLSGAPLGNKALEERGATVISDRQALDAALRDLPRNATTQLSLIGRPQ